MYALSVMLTIDPAHVEDFKAAALRQAANTKANETGCLAFEVFVSADDPTRFYLHEAYVNKAAVDDIHDKSPYMAEFRKTTQNWVVARERLCWNSADKG